MPDRPTPEYTLTMAQARQLWSQAQALGSGGDALDVPGGWIRALGGVDPYLSLWARCEGVSRSGVDAALAEGALSVIPGVRGCIWLVPRGDIPLALKVGLQEFRSRNLREMARLGVEESEMEALGEAIIKTLALSPMSPEDLRAALPHRSYRTFGEEGKRLGHSTTVPSALRRLEGAGRIRRILEGGRLDSQRYVWALQDRDMTELENMPSDNKKLLVALGERYFRWAGPARLSEFQRWSGFGKRACEAALKTLELVPGEIKGGDEIVWMTQQAHANLASTPEDDRFYFLPALDGLLSLRESPAMVADEAHHEREILGMHARKKITLAKARWMSQRPLIHQGRWVGIWSWHLDDQAVIFKCFDPLSKKAQAAAQAAADRLTHFITQDLEGCVRGNGIDSERNQRARMAFVLEMKEGPAKPPAKMGKIRRIM